MLILGGIALVCGLLFGRLLFRQKNRLEEEREWFAAAVRYEFSARIDSVRMLNENTASLFCSVTEGNPQSHREDSLKRVFKEHDMLYLIFRQSGDSIRFIVGEGKDLMKGDSVRVSSEKDSIQFFRNGEPVMSGKLSNTLTGFGRPFFLKGKKN